MKIRTGFEISYESSQPTPMVLMLSVHPSRFHDLVTPQTISFDPPTPSTDYRDSFGNVWSRLGAPAGWLTIATDFIIADAGEPDPTTPDAVQHPVEDLPDEVPTLRPDFLRGHGGMVIAAACLGAISWAAGGIEAVAAFGRPQWGAAL